MAGLLQQGGQPAPQAQPGPPAPAAPPGPQGAPPPTQGGGADMDPQQGPQQRDQLVNAMLEALYGPMLDQVRAILQQHEDEPVKGIGRVVAQLLTTVWLRLAEQGKTAPPGVIFQAGMMVVQAVGEMAIRLQLIDEQDGETIEAAFMLALGEFGKATADKMPDAQRQRYRELIAALREGKQMSQGQAAPPQGEAPAPAQGEPAEPQRSKQPRQPTSGGV